MKLVAANELGRKTGRGIYDYRGAEPVVSTFVLSMLEAIAGTARGRMRA